MKRSGFSFPIFTLPLQPCHLNRVGSTLHVRASDLCLRPSAPTPKPGDAICRMGIRRKVLSPEPWPSQKVFVQTYAVMRSLACARLVLFMSIHTHLPRIVGRCGAHGSGDAGLVEAIHDLWREVVKETMRDGENMYFSRNLKRDDFLPSAYICSIPLRHPSSTGYSRDAAQRKLTQAEEVKG
ncbi:hypothetical protein CALVIDRAFT_245840 [Calocera viscosa TUFC12733]|uniref:Uncharacterized protein n=1 Tax=Calocera viscosa (strain TUFC12733) TaxID=1330018 RepID=A0A167JIE0_CALVF|nr:hypothetical protein CALVIDRAFT_245840 [Calocera viscosa TUFC12733]